MKTTVEIPDQLMKMVKTYAHRHKRTFKEVLIEALKRIVANAESIKIEPDWKRCFGRFQGSPTETAFIQEIIDKDFSTLDPEDWK